MDLERAQQLDVSNFEKLSPGDKLELQQSLNNEMQKAKIQECALGPLSSSSIFLPPYTHTRPLMYIEEGIANPPLPLFNSRTRTDRHVLEEVRDGGDIVEQAGPEGGAVRA